MNNDSGDKITDAHIVDAPAIATEEPGGISAAILRIADVLDALIKTHFILAALLFPTAIKAKSQEQAGLSAFYRVWCLLFGVILLAANISSIVALCTRSHLIDFAKVCFMVIAAWTSIIALIIVNQEKQIQAALFAIEEEAGQIRDESVMLIRAGQAALKALNKKLYGEEVRDQFQAAVELLKSVGPLAVLFFNQEKSIMRWGMAGMDLSAKAFKLAQKVFAQK